MSEKDNDDKYNDYVLVGVVAELVILGGIALLLISLNCDTFTDAPPICQLKILRLR